LANPLLDHQHLELAEEFYEAFRKLPPNGPSGIPINWPRYFMLCHATELALKAFLLAHGWTEQQIRAQGVRHDVTKLLTEAVALGLKIGPLAHHELELLSQAHEEFWHRYPKQTADPVFIIDHFEPYVVELLKAVRLEIRGGNVLYVCY